LIYILPLRAHLHLGLFQIAKLRELLHHYCAIHSQKGESFPQPLRTFQRPEVSNEDKENCPHAAAQEKIYPTMTKKL
jgi:hypothetical protein